MPQCFEHRIIFRYCFLIPVSTTILILMVILITITITRTITITKYIYISIIKQQNNNKQTEHTVNKQTSRPMYINEPFLKASNSPNSQSNGKKQRTTTAKVISEYQFTNNNNTNTNNKNNNNSKAKIPKTNINTNTKPDKTSTDNRQNRAKDTTNIRGHNSKLSQIEESEGRSSNNITHLSQNKDSKQGKNNGKDKNKNKGKQAVDRYDDIGRFHKQKVLDLIGDLNSNSIPSNNELSDGDEDGVGTSQGVDEGQFEDYLLRDLTKLIKKWNRKLNMVEEDLSNYEGVIENESQINAFKQCVELLNAEFDQAQAIHEASRNLIEKKVLQVDDYKLRLIKQAEQLREQIKDILKQREEIEQKKKEHDKKKNTKKLLQEKVVSQNQKLEQLRKSILECKEKSYAQKNQFVELQSCEFRVQTEIRELQQQEQAHEQENIRRQKYEQMLKIKQKILNATENMDIEVVPHLERKIEKMAQLRSELKNIDQALNSSMIKIEDQNIVIEALREKSYHEQAYYSEEGNLYNQYRKKYNQIYFGGTKNSRNDTGSTSEWNDYSLYLKHLVNKNRNANKRIHTEIPDLLTRKKFSQNSLQAEQKNTQLMKKSRKSSEQDDVLDLRSKNTDLTRKQGRQNYGDPKKVSKNLQIPRSDRLPTKKQSTGSTKLPKLVKLQGKASQQKNIKSRVKQGMASNKNILNDEEISLESIRSNDSNVSGEIIEVQFHKKS